jgi:hypothetical protein
VTTTEQAPAAASAPDGRGGGWRRGRRPPAAVAGLLSAGVALGVAELPADLVGPQSSPVVAVGDTVITLVPEPVKAFAIRTFGEDDKTALVVGTLAVLALYAAVVGVLALRGRASGIALFGLVGAAAAVTAPAGGPFDALPALVGALAGAVAVGGLLAGTARRLGIPLGAFLREHGIRSGSDRLVRRSSDGMTIGAPTRSALEVEDAMIAFGMNGETLSVEHGFPVRMIMPGLYGFVSACTWMVGIGAATDAYRTERDRAAQAPIKIASRIDTPAPLRRFPPAAVRIAGVASRRPAASAPSRSGSTRGRGCRRSSPRRWTPTCGGSGCCPTTSPRLVPAHRPRHQCRWRGADRGTA